MASDRGLRRAVNVTRRGHAAAGPAGWGGGAPLRWPSPQAAVSCPAPLLVGRAADQKAWARLGPGKVGEVSDCLCPPRAGRPRHLSRREETLARRHAYLISRRPPPNLASPPQQKGFPGPKTLLGNGWTPGTRQSEPKALAPALSRALLEARLAS